ncbi:GspE/PulE family protein [Limisalsivibrio acetivorans]|uniref:GspE/PulE family protein n=1 Tax=Limisalsivibrio acetivorans TaxID=1304888 RepID=UPI0003B5DC57|nr:ATPase, T2SS/T4P/T4SS family [Limisalsivibrio acetivorans]
MKKLFGEILTERNACTVEDIDKALEVQKSYGGKIGTILMNMGTITEEQLLTSLAEQLSLTYAKDIDGLTPYDTGVDWKILVRTGIIPVSENDGRIKTLTNEPLQMEIFSLIETVTGKRHEIVLTREENINRLAAMVEETEIESSTNLVLDIDDEVDRLKELASEAPVIKLVNTLMNKAMEQNASDIHYESLKNSMVVRFRVDGIMHHVETVPLRLKLAVITRLKLLSGMNIAENRLPQDGRISMKIAGKEIDIRASSVPTQHGESFVLRLLGKDNLDYSLDSLGFYADHRQIIETVTSKPNGIFLTTGPTGSGKTTTLYSVLNRLNGEDVKIITVEDPVEYEFSGINQIQVKPEIGYKFSNALRSILRQDPDIIMVGEIRDKETAEIAIQASLTGHLVLSTLHTNSALAAVTRLLDMGVDYFLVKASLVGLMAQRLVRRVCPNCAEKDPGADEARRIYDIDRIIENSGFAGSFNPMKGKGCAHCGGTGYKGRMVISEIAPFDRQLAAAFQEDPSFSDLHAVNQRTMIEDGLLKYAEGKTSLDEILRVVQ